MIKEHLTSLDYYLYCEPQSVVKVKSVEDVACGEYPIFYAFDKNDIFVSSSVMALIKHLKSLNLNKKFKPKDYLKDRRTVLGFLAKLPRIINRISPGLIWDLLLCYSSWETIDLRIKKLMAFEMIEECKKHINFSPTYKITDINEVIEKSAHYIKNFINDIEKQFPEYEHIALVGGKDSQLILLAPKINESKWHLFSAEPNYKLVIKWIRDNNININKTFYDDNVNKETDEDFKNKILAGDLYSDPSHIRWMPQMKQIALSFNNKCIFWGGSSGESFYKYYKVDHGYGRARFFKMRKVRYATMNSNYHQVFKNFVKCPYLSPYHSREIWQDLYQHFDPLMIKPGTDLRSRIGEKMFGRKIKWIEQNPGPIEYQYPYVNMYNLYLNFIKNGLNQK